MPAAIWATRTTSAQAADHRGQEVTAQPVSPGMNGRPDPGLGSCLRRYAVAGERHAWPVNRGSQRTKNDNYIEAGLCAPARGAHQRRLVSEGISRDPGRVAWDGATAYGR